MLRLAFALLLCLPLLAGCGDEEPPDGVFLRVLTSEADGAPVGALRIKALDDGEGREYELVETDEADVYRAPGARPGPYRIFTDTGWGMLWTGRKGTSAPLLRGHDFPPALVRLGKPRSLYVAIADPSLPSAPVTTTWAADVRALDAGDEVPFRAADLEISDQGEGIVGLHFSETQWTRGVAIRAVGVMGDGSISEMLRYTVRDADLFELPRMSLVFPSPQAPLTVHVLGSDGKPAADGTPVTIDVGGIPLAARITEKSFQGTARFETLPTLGQGLRVAVGEGKDAPAWYLDQETWRRRQAMHVLLVDPVTSLRIGLPIGGEQANVREARARTAGADGFGLVPLAAAKGGGTDVVIPGSTQDLLVGYDDGTWSAFMGKDAAELQLLKGPKDGAGRRSRVRGIARGAGVQGRVQFTRVMPAEHGLPERMAGGQGFQAALTLDGAFEIELPPGKYKMQIWTVSGPRGRTLTQTFGPGSDVRLQLSTR